MSNVGSPMDRLIHVSKQCMDEEHLKEKMKKKIVLIDVVICPKAIISSRKSQVLQCELWDWDPGMGIQNDDYLGRSVPLQR